MKTQRPPKLTKLVEIEYTTEETEEVSKDKFGGVAAKKIICKQTLRIKGTDESKKVWGSNGTLSKLRPFAACFILFMGLLVISPIVVFIAKNWYEWLFAYGFSHFLGIILSIEQITLLLEKALDVVLIVIGAMLLSWLNLK